MLLRLIALSLVIALLYAGPAYISLSDKSGKRFTHLELRPTKVKPALPLNQVDPSRQKQRIIGFGGAFTEASAINFQLLPEKLQHEVMDLYFGPSGNDYTVGRVHMDSCDFSVSSYNFDNVTDDFDLKHWSLDNGHDLHTLVPLAQEAVRREPDLQVRSSLPHSSLLCCPH
jgi:glucosylceramidase